MSLILNIRGTNGSGKTTLARAFLPPNMKGDAAGGPVDLVHFPSPTKRDPQRIGHVEGYWREDTRTIVVGSYANACGGLDTVASFDRSFRAIRKAAGLVEMHWGPGHVIAEGILASTVYGSWAEFAKEVNDIGLFRFAFVYLTTPLEVCLERIKQRQEAAGRVREIKEELVADKFKAIAATREKALRDGHLVYDLPWERGLQMSEDPEGALRMIMNGHGEQFRAA